MPEDKDLISPELMDEGIPEGSFEDDPRLNRRASRRRPKLIKDREEQDKIMTHILKTLQDDEDARAEWLEMRLDRYAKLRGWRGKKDYPWENASNAHIPMILQDTLRTQDTLVNATLAVRPVINAKSTKRTDKPKEDTINNLIDTQVFSEQEGEEMIGYLAQKFVEDGRFTAYIPWVRETKNLHDIKVLPPLEGQPEDDVFAIEELIMGGSIIPNVESAEKTDQDGYEWKVRFRDSEGKEFDGVVSIYFRDNMSIEAHYSMPVRSFDGPKLIPKAIEDVVAPWRCGNLQPPGPSNPFGSQHVRIIDYPSLDEIKSLKEQGFYDEITDEDIERLEGSQIVKSDTSSSEEMKDQKDVIEGIEAGQGIDGKKTFKRIMSFDRYDVNGDGLDEDVIFWMIEQPKVMCRVRMLTEMFPTSPPRRPLAEAQFLPVAEDRLYGIYMGELMEPLHDIICTTINQIIDNSTINNTPFFFFKPGTGMRNDVIRLNPGDGYPLNNPSSDVHFPNIIGKSQSEGFNVITLIQQYSDKLTMIGDVNRGQVPKGGSSALRTQGGMNAILQQGEARPERILRRFFGGIKQVYEIFHALNQRLLPTPKQVRLNGYIEPDKDPYHDISDIEAIRADMDFEFQAALTNTSPGAIKQSLSEVAQIAFSPLSLQLGTVKPEGIYNLQRDLIKVLKLDPDRYLTRPQGLDIDKTKATSEEVISIIWNKGALPDVVPMEPTAVHFQKLQEFTKSDDFRFFDQKQGAVLQAYMGGVMQRLQQEQEQLKRVQAAQLAQKNGGGSNGDGVPPEAGPQNPPVNQNELIDETLPGAGGGANSAQNGVG